MEVQPHLLIGMGLSFLGKNMNSTHKQGSEINRLMDRGAGRAIKARLQVGQMTVIAKIG